jgi:hypothetical protein
MTWHIRGGRPRKFTIRLSPGELKKLEQLQQARYGEERSWYERSTPSQVFRQALSDAAGLRPTVAPAETSDAAIATSDRLLEQSSSTANSRRLSDRLPATRRTKLRPRPPRGGR